MKMWVLILVTVLLICGLYGTSDAGDISVESDSDTSLKVILTWSYVEDWTGEASKTVTFKWRRKTPPGTWRSATKTYTRRWFIYFTPAQIIEMTNTFTITGLDPGTTYEVRCDSGPIVEATTSFTAQASSMFPLTKATLDKNVVTLTLPHGTYEQDLTKIRGAVTVSGIRGVTLQPSGVQRISDTEVSVVLNFDGTDFDWDATLTFRVGPDAIVDSAEAAFIVKISVLAAMEAVSAVVTSPLTEATLDKRSVTLILTGVTYVQDLATIRGAVTVSGIQGVTLQPSGVQRISNTEVSVVLNFDGTDFDTDATLTFSVFSAAIVDYAGAAFTAKTSVTAVFELTAREQNLSLYWTDGYTDKIQRATLDGSNVEDLVTTGLSYPHGIALDVAGGKMYWTDFGTEKIQRANLDGSNVQDLVTAGLDGPHGIALDVASGKMYWTDISTVKIQRANLDGSNVQDLVTTGLDSPSDIALDVAGGKMYWTDTSIGTAKIQRANLDGSNVQDLVTTGLDRPSGIALDVAGGKMYWTDGYTDKIQRANLDGSNVQDLVTTGLEEFPDGIALDVAGGKMYWTDTDTAKIQRANLDGSNVQDLVTTGLDRPNGIALGPPSQTLPPTSSGQAPDLVVEAVRADPSTVAPGQVFKLYATLKNSGTAESAATTVRYYRSTDNSISTTDRQLGTGNRKPLAVNATIRRYLSITAPTTPGTYYYGVCVDSVPNESNTANNCSTAVTVTVAAPVVSADVNDDGAVDVQDLVYVAQRYGQTGTTRADVNTDGVVNINDLILVTEVLDAATAAAPAVHPGALETLTVAAVKLWLSEARQLDLTDPKVRRGIQFFEQLLMVLVPKETALLTNYPNPFNPETWIPYQLATDTDVLLSIYDVDGALVRELDLGHQGAGYYTDRSRAAYWDGRNAWGEGVASGVYFYQFSAGDYSATRKMLILK